VSFRAFWASKLTPLWTRFFEQNFRILIKQAIQSIHVGHLIIKIWSSIPPSFLPGHWGARPPASPPCLRRWSAWLSAPSYNSADFKTSSQRKQCRMTVAQLMNQSGHDLFCKLCAPTHALNHLLPPAGNCVSLRTRGHSHQLPEYSTDLHKKSFRIRCLYCFVKWNTGFLVFLLCIVCHSDFAFYVYYFMCGCRI